MILPIVAYGDPVLRKECQEVDADYPGLKQLLSDMWETMYAAGGVGLAAPQIGKDIRIFIIDPSPFAQDLDEVEDEEERAELEGLIGLKKTFINPIIVEENGDKWGFEEGCLSIPGIREEVVRKSRLTIEYYNEDFELIEETYDGLAARVIQHEYDHVEGILFTDLLAPLKKRFLQRKLSNISKGNVKANYRMRFPQRR